MSCTDEPQQQQQRRSLTRVRSSLSALAILAGCASPQRANTPTAPPVAPSAEPAPATGADRPPKPLPPNAPAPIFPVLGLPKPVRTLADLRMQAALRLVAASPQLTYITESPPVLLAIPVLEIELHPDGRVKRINVIRKPTQALDTVQLAIDAVHRAAPFGNVSRMPEPWKFTETFLFNDDRLFKPRTLD